MNTSRLPTAVVVLLVAGGVLAPVLWPLAAADVLTNRFNNRRTGATLDEKILTTGTVGPGSFGKLWTLYADGQIVAQPLYVSQLHIDTQGNSDTPLVQGTFNVVIVATMHNTVYAYDADRENRLPDGHTKPLWALWLGQPRPGSKEIDMFSTNDPEWGILSTPVISSDKRTLYVVAWHDSGAQGLRFQLHAIDMEKGSHRMPPVQVGQSSTDPSQPCRDQSPFNPCRHKQRAALLLVNNLLYVGFGGDGNRGTLFVYDAPTLMERARWSPTPTGRDGGLWQSGQGFAADAAGDVYLMTANGSVGTNNGQRNYGNSFVKLRMENGQLVVKDFFTPCNFQFLNTNDLDLGSGGPVLVPDPPGRVIGGGKEGAIYVLPQASLGQLGGNPPGQNCQNAAGIQQVNAFDPVVHDGQTHYGNIHGSPVYWRGPDGARVYAWGENSRLKAYRYAQGRLQNVGTPRTSTFRPPDGMPGGMLAISANGARAGTGILWAVVPLNGDANRQRGVLGILLALDAQDVSRTLWTSEQFMQRDRLGLFAKFNPPLIANGKVYVATYGDDEPLRTYQPDGGRPNAFPRNYYVAVYGMLPTTPPARAIVNQDGDDVTVVRASSAPVTLDKSRCVAAEAGAVDCTTVLAELVSAPPLHRVVLSSDPGPVTCSLVRVVTASVNGGLLNASGVGFFSSEAADGEVGAANVGRFVPTNELRPLGPATLANGTAATLHEFVAVANCNPGNAPSRARLFKPYMQFENAADGRIFRNWDRSDNYSVSAATPGFDRSAAVLRP